MENLVGGAVGECLRDHGCPPGCDDQRAGKKLAPGLRSHAIQVADRVCLNRCHGLVVNHVFGKETRDPAHVLGEFAAQRKLQTKIEVLEKPIIFEQEVGEGPRCQDSCRLSDFS